MGSFHDKVVYQAYPKSFKDTDGNGLGDLKGITEKLPYIKELGADLIWINPFYESPQRDNGYDISDYKSINPDFGTWEDFDELITEAQKLDLGIMLDMVLNHVSIEHEWFQKALAGDKKYQDYFYLRKAQEDGSLPTNWDSKFGGDAWAPFGDTDYYYLCLFDKTQADLDWHNEEVRQELFDVVNFWLEKGVKGFRFDVINVTGKSENMEDAEDGVGKSHYTDTPVVHEYLQELNENTFGKYDDVLTVGEMSSTTIGNSIQYSNPEYNELDMVFSFHHLKVDYENGEKWTTAPFDFIQLKELLTDWQEKMTEGGGWNAVFWNNHDQPRANSRFGDPENYPVETATMLAQTIHFLRGTPYIYQGEEIGMTNPGFESIEDYRDVETLNAYDELSDQGLAEEEIMEIIKEKSRDNARTPMQWDDSEHAGFTSGTPWIGLADNYKEVNTESAFPSKEIFKYYQKLIQLRKDMPLIQEGDIHTIELNHPSIFAYKRELNGEILLVLNHFYEEEDSIQIPDELLQQEAAYLIGNSGERKLEKDFTMGPYETAAFLIK